MHDEPPAAATCRDHTSKSDRQRGRSPCLLVLPLSHQLALLTHNSTKRNGDQPSPNRPPTSATACDIQSLTPSPGRAPIAPEPGRRPPICLQRWPNADVTVHLVRCRKSYLARCDHRWAANHTGKPKVNNPTPTLRQLRLLLGQRRLRFRMQLGITQQTPPMGPAHRKTKAHGCLQSYGSCESVSPRGFNPGC